MSMTEPEFGDQVVMLDDKALWNAGDRGRIIQVNDRAPAGVGYLIRFPRLTPALKDRVWVGAHEFKVIQ